MHVSTRAALLAATLVWATSASAQTYTLEEAVRTAVANSPQGEATAARLDGLNAARGEFMQHYAVFSGAAQRVCAVGEAKIVLVHTAGEQAGRRAAVPPEWLDTFWPEGAS